MASTESLSKLLETMPAIAEAVNSFRAPEVQRAAFDVLISAAVGEPALPVPSPPNGVTAPVSVKLQGNNRKKKTSPSKAAKKSKVTAISVDSSINLEPADGVSLVDFIEDKRPSSLVDKSMACIYWLKNIAETDAVGVSQVYTCYKRMGWQTPKNPANHLQAIAASKKWLDTSNMDDVTLTHTGTQFVEHELPKVAKT